MRVRTNRESAEFRVDVNDSTTNGSDFSVQFCLNEHKRKLIKIDDKIRVRNSHETEVNFGARGVKQFFKYEFVFVL